MEGLNHMFRKAKTNGWVRGFSAQPGMEITHLFYADDALIFCEAEETQIRHLRAILTIFEGISGLHVNWLKSHLFPINNVDNMSRLRHLFPNNNVDNMSRLAETLGCQVDALPTKYLGLPLGAKNKELEV
uniref:Reverse transcriptase domain-containing protein n=1 Tax=Solanum tuberosum TaxID=4113 RepID=M1CP87_SOLTU